MFVPTLIRDAPWRFMRLWLGLCIGLLIALLVPAAAGAAISEFPVPTSGSDPVGIAAGPDGALWFTEQVENKIGRITTAGSISEFPIATPSGDPGEIAAGPDGALWFTESSFKIGRITTSGSISEFPIPTVGGQPFGVTAGPDGAMWFTELNVSKIGRITTSGSITEFPTPTPNSGPTGIVTGPDGALWFTEQVGNKIGRITTSGSISEFPIPTGGSDPVGIGVGPDGALWFTETLGNSIGRITSAGSISEFPIPTGASNPLGIAVGPDGALWFTEAVGNKIGRITTAGSISEFPIPTPNSDPAFQIAAGPDGAMWFPEGIGNKIGRITVNPTKHATATSVSCSPSVFAPGDATVCRARVTDTASAGQSTPTGTVSFTNSGSGTFFGSPCKLSGSGASASCAVLFTAFPRGGRIIAAAYGGDATHSASNGFTGVTVAVPASTDGCVVFGHGRITAANGDKASFRGLVAALPPRGVEFYRDNGPAGAFRVVSTSVDALTCTDDATKASVFGTAKINGAGSVEYRIDVELTAWEWGKDTYRIRLSNGYDSGVQQIRHGDVDIHIHTSEHRHHDVDADQNQGGEQDGG
jgi:streptogramin lyase